MIDYSAISLDKLIIHWVGNKHNEKENTISETLCEVDEELESTLINFFMTPFSNQIEVSKFRHSDDINLNELYSYSNELFDEPENFRDVSVKIINHLFEQSDHPHIKTGEVLIAFFTDIIFDDQLTDAIGIFKIERKDKYFSISKDSSSLKINTKLGINSKKLDKGCLVINIEEEGLRIISVDNNNYDTEYWKNKFLNVEYVKDSNYHTSSYVDFCKSYSEEIVNPEKGKDEQIAFLNKSMKYLTNNYEFNIDEFADEVFEDPETKNTFFNYKENFEKDQDVVVQESFPISQNSVKAKKRTIKSLISLDTKIQIKLDSKDPEETKKYIEKGYDNQRGMNFYKVYFNVEKN